VISPGELQPISLRISVTDRCQLRCLYCMPPEGVEKREHHEILSYEEIVGFVRALKSRFSFDKIHLTGGEPLVRPDIVKLVSMLAAENVAQLALTTNGLLLGPMARELKSSGLHRANVSFDTLNEKTFEELTRGGNLRLVREGIKTALEEGLAPVKLNTLILRGFNDTEVTALAQWAVENGCHIRFLELMPIGYARADFEKLFVPTTEIKKCLEETFELKPLPVPRGASNREFAARDSDGREGVIGFISSHTRPFCADCSRLRLTSDGHLISCLARGEGPDIKGLLRQKGGQASRELREIVARELNAKEARLDFTTPRPMGTVGG